jgi:hypothetical protein
MPVKRKKCLCVDVAPKSPKTKEKTKKERKKEKAKQQKKTVPRATDL